MIVCILGVGFATANLVPQTPTMVSSVEVTGKDIRSRKISITSPDLPGGGLVADVSLSDVAKAKVGDRLCVEWKSEWEWATAKILDQQSCEGSKK
jgi:hypothetical protein